MKHIFFFIWLGQMSRCNAQDLSILLTDSKIKTSYKGYVDKDSIRFTACEIADVETKVIFDKVSINEPDSSVLVVGQLVVELTDTTVRMGFCCSYVFIAETVSDSLISIEKIGVINSNLDNPSKPDGYFEVVFKPMPQKKLFFCSELGAGLHEYSIAKTKSDIRGSFAKIQLNSL